MELIRTIFSWLVYNISFACAANILAILPMASPSHHIWNSPLLLALARKGHNVTVVSHLGQKYPVRNLTDLVIERLIDKKSVQNDYEEMSETSSIFTASILFSYVSDICIKILKSNAWMQLVNYPPDTKFDLAIIESLGTECFVGILPQFGNPPIVTVNGFTTPPWMFETTGSPKAISHVPHFLHSSSDHMSFWQRAMNLFFHVQTYILYHYNYIPNMDKIAKQHYGPNIPSFYKIKEKISLEFANFHPAIDYPYAKSPSLIPIAGIHIGDLNPLPLDLQKFLDNAKDGVVYFSFGSNIKSNQLKTEKRKLILEAFAAIPQKVLWKFEDDNLPHQPANVKIGKWLPQSDILAHSNVKVFITHSGLLSIQEAIYHGVPVIGIPFYGDQPMNIDKIVNRKAGIRLNFKDLSKENLLKALKIILQDNSYRRSMKILSAQFRDNPETPLERAVFWTEYVLRHNGALHLQSEAKYLSVFQYYLLDVMAALTIIPMIFLALFYNVCCKSNSKNKNKMKKS